MSPSKATCMLLMSDHMSHSDAAEKFARALFDVRCAPRFHRRETVLPAEIARIAQTEKIDYILNYLSPVLLKKEILASIKKASINFHPAPPEWPGVGTASYALYEGDKTYG